MEAALIGLLAFCGVIIAALIAALYKGRNSKGNNPNSTQRILDKLLGMEARAARVEEKMEQAILVLTEIRTILDRGERH